MSFIAELQRRKVVRAGVAYLVAAWALVQVADTVFPRLGLPDWSITAVVALSLLGFPVVLLFAWVFELTPEGIRRDPGEADAADAPPAHTRWIELAVILLVTAGLGWFAWDRFAQAPLVPEPGATGPSRAMATIAVLPFVNLSSDPEQEYFSDGLSEEILNLLAQLPDLKVIGRASSFAFKDRDEDLRVIGEQLGVAHLLEGSVRKFDEELRIAARLIEVRGGTQLWSQQYDRRLENVFVIQSDIAQAIAKALRINLIGASADVPAPLTGVSFPAYDLVLRARELMRSRTRYELEAARGLLDQALALDPDFAPAYAAAAKTTMLLSDGPAAFGDIPMEKAIALAQRLVEQALILDPGLAEGHAVQGLVYLARGDFAASEIALDRALAINPSLSDALGWRALVLSTTGRLPEAAAARYAVAEADPLSLNNLANLGVILSRMGETEEALVLSERLKRLAPANALGYRQRAVNLAYQGKLAQARRELDQATVLDATLISLERGFINYTLADFEAATSPPVGREYGPALVGLRSPDQAIAALREEVAAAPLDLTRAYFLLRTLSLAGRHADVLEVYRDRWEDLAAFEAAYADAQWGREVAPIAAAQLALGQEAALAQTLSRWRRRLQAMRDKGYRAGWFRFVEASSLALAGERQAFLDALSESIDLGHRDPLLTIDPAFSRYVDDVAFKALVERTYRLINIERGKLDLAPISVEQFVGSGQVAASIPAR